MPSEVMKPARILGIETATFCGSVALLSGDRLLGSRTLDSSVTHSERLLGAISSLLEEAGLALKDLTGLAVSIGPGSFTGVRIGLSAAKGLAVARNLPIVSVSTLDALAVRAGRDSRLICPVIDARRNEVFVGAYRWPRQAEIPMEKISPAVMPIEKFFKQLRGQCLFLGDGALHYREKIAECLGDRAMFVPPHRILPSAEEVAWLGQRRLARGESDDSAQLEPTYIRSSDARLPS